MPDTQNRYQKVSPVAQFPENILGSMEQGNAAF